VLAARVGDGLHECDDALARRTVVPGCEWFGRRGLLYHARRRKQASDSQQPGTREAAEFVHGCPLFPAADAMA
jgi:hypothetical protein